MINLEPLFWLLILKQAGRRILGHDRLQRQGNDIDLYRRGADGFGIDVNRQGIFGRQR